MSSEPFKIETEAMIEFSTFQQFVILSLYQFIYMKITFFKTCTMRTNYTCCWLLLVKKEKKKEKGF